jgi:peptide/nickel transport system permease protein
MAKLLARRALQGVVIVWLVATLTFFLIALAPGDAVDVAYAGPFVPQQAREQIRQEFCLDRGIAARYGCWVRSLAKGDLGWSIPLGRPVADVLRDAIPNTLVLMSLAIIATFALGVGTGVAQARRPGGKLDRIAGGLAMFLYALPDFWCALIVLFIFSYKLRWLPVTGMTDPLMYPYFDVWQRAGDRVAHLILPVGTLAIVSAAGISRYQRAAMLDVMSQDFVRTARAKGLDEGRILRRHVLRNALLPVITLFGFWLPTLLGGAVLIERIFSWPGMGLLATNAVGTRDYPLLIACTMAASALVVAGSLVADLLYAVADPRVRAA